MRWQSSAWRQIRQRPYFDCQKAAVPPADREQPETVIGPAKACAGAGHRVSRLSGSSANRAAEPA
jgi:hypothetical protein